MWTHSPGPSSMVLTGKCKWVSWEKRMHFWSLFSPDQLQWRNSFWRVEHLTCLILSIRMQIYLFKAVFKVTLITGLPTDRAAMIIQSINQGKNYASYWLTNYCNQIFTPLFGTMGTALEKATTTTTKTLNTKNSCFTLLWAGGRGLAAGGWRGWGRAEGSSWGPLSPCFHSSTSLPAPACNVVKH